MKPHTPVMVNEVVNYLRALEGGCFFDGTFGMGGHSKAILTANNENIVYAVDRDPETIKFAEALSKIFPNRFYFFVCSFKDAFDFFNLNQCKGFLLDLGISQYQLYSKKRGFSFHDEESLDCRINPAENVPTGADILNAASPAELKAVLKKGGVGKELPYVLKSILMNRPFKSAKELGDAIRKSIPRKLHVASKSNYRHVVMQALRMEVNKEREHLAEFFCRLKNVAPRFSRVCVICFNSLEDKIVTSTFRKWARDPEKIGALLTKKAVKPNPDEISRNPSSRSALLRLFEFRNV
ncbi:MAG: 16S rRNA (cytosine(1402)-N(4))-methyltransferase RsmH [Deltaproteobacteria bacterium]|nr:16S rRNA (cytosine(1402)-N(4))-methyltransferase RsmH [Deltaproteobacteria bacterium]